MKGVQAAVCTLSLTSCSVACLCRRGPWLAKPIASRLFRVARLRPLTPTAVVAFADQAPRGQRVPLDQFRLLLIDKSAESVESFLPSRSRTWRRSRKHQSPAHTANSSRDSSRGSRRRHPLWTHLDFHVEAGVFCRHLRQFSPLTHLELRVEVHVVDTSCRLISIVPIEAYFP